jgi:hypothetical protein
LSGGLLTTSNTIFTPDVSQGFYQTGGRHVVSGRLHLDGNWPHYTMTGGELDAANIEVVNSSFTHTGGTVSNSTSLTLNSSTWSEGTAGQVLGLLQLNGASNSTSALVLPSSGACIVRFADSSSRGWSNGVALQILNWNGSLTGGGTQQVVFGNSTTALTPAQLRGIVFDYSGTNYPARILSNGEIIPDIAANASPMLSLQSQSGGVMQLTIGGVSGRTYEVEVSTDLLNWTAWTQVNSTGTNPVVDTNTTGAPQRFYRARLLP